LVGGLRGALLLEGCLRFLKVHNLKNLNGNTARDFKKVDSSSVDEDVAKNLGKVINNGVDKFWAKRGKVDPAKKLRGFVIGKKAS